MENYKEFQPSVLALFLGYEKIKDKLYAQSILLFPKSNEIAYKQEYSIPAGHTLPGIHVHAIESKFANVGIGVHATIYGESFAFHQVKIPFIKRLPGGKFSYHVAKVVQNDGAYTTLRFEDNDRMIPKARRTKCVKLRNPDNTKIECGNQVLLWQDSLLRWTLVRDITKERHLLKSGER